MVAIFGGSEFVPVPVSVLVPLLVLVRTWLATNAHASSIACPSQYQYERSTSTQNHPRICGIAAPEMLLCATDQA